MHMYVQHITQRNPALRLQGEAGPTGAKRFELRQAASKRSKARYDVEKRAALLAADAVTYHIYIIFIIYIILV